MNSDELTIVTGFFDCNRGKHKEQARTNDKYFEYFKFWARIQNKVVIYGTNDTVQKALKIRKDFGRENETEIHAVSDITAIEPVIFKRMKEIEDKGDFNNYRVRDFDVSNEALYDYVTFMKFWMMKQTAELHPDCGTLVWMDFGWNHGGDVYANPLEYDFHWKYEFKHDKVHLFSLRNPNNEINYWKLMLMTDGIMGGLFVSDASLCDALYRKIREALLSLLSLDMYDDEQMLMTMAYKTDPDFFEIHISDWFMPIKEYGGEHLTVKPKDNGKWKMLRRKTLAEFAEAAFVKIFKHTNLERYRYAKRIEKIIYKM